LRRKLAARHYGLASLARRGKYVACWCSRWELLTDPALEELAARVVEVATEVPVVQLAAEEGGSGGVGDDEEPTMAGEG
jgi:hypothetical protein